MSTPRAKPLELPNPPICPLDAGALSFRFHGGYRRAGQPACHGRAGSLHYHGNCSRCGAWYAWRYVQAFTWTLEPLHNPKGASR
jgi:hypothetical protein